MFTSNVTASMLLAQIADIGWQERLLFPLQYHSLQLLCTVIVGAVLGLLGCFVILRRMALIGDAISHAVLPGVVIAFLLLSTGVLGLFAGALLAGILTAVGINLVARHSRVKEDAAIGIVFTAMFALGIILISRLPAGTHFDLKCFLFGDPLAIQRADLISIAVIAPLVVGTVALLFQPLKLMCFDPVQAATAGFNVNALHYLLMLMLAATIVAALRSVGVIMAVAMLITPAAVAYQLTNRLRTMLVLATLCGAFAAGVGMFLAFLVDWPPGPAMVLVATLLFAAAMLFSREHGVVAAAWRRYRIRQHILHEDILKAILLGDERGSPPRRADLPRLLGGLPERTIRAALARLTRSGHISPGTDPPALTEAGRRWALELVRAHRLWESYLATHDVRDPELHERAEQLEHAHGLADDLADVLGHPRRDPHGSVIPPQPPA